MQFQNVLYFLVWAGLFVMMRFGCGAHVMGHGHHHGRSRSDDRGSGGNLRWTPPDKATYPVYGTTVQTAGAKSAVHDGNIYYLCFKPQTKRDWRSFGAFSAFLVALFTEMYGFPLTIYLLSGWLQSRYPNVNWFSHDAGHLLEMMFGWKANPHFAPFHILSFTFIGGGFILISAGWKALYEAQRRRTLAISGIYSYVRHPQYVGFILVMFGFLLQWPTLLTLAITGRAERREAAQPVSL